MRAGTAELFDDSRMHWGFERLGGLDGRSVLELGPLEGGHSYMAQRAGASRVVAVESNRQAFLKCLVVKELLDLERCKFLCGDASAYLRETADTFDVCFACGILYHMVEPVELLDLISRRAKRLLLWTHYYDEKGLDGLAAGRALGRREERQYRGFRYAAHRHRYHPLSRGAGFWGGTQPFSYWLPRADLLRALEHFGWHDIQIAFEETTANGPALALVAECG
ncbi:MAG: DUF1698 domain-containing protein [Gaiellales bacterium]